MITQRVVACLFLGSALVAGCAPAGAPSPTAVASPTVVATGEASPSAAAIPSAALPAPVDIEAAGALAIDATSSIDWVVVVDGRAWIAGAGKGIGIFDESGKLRESVAVSGLCESMDVGLGAVWSARCIPAGIIRIDAATRAVDEADLDAPIVDSEASVGVGEGAVWLVAGTRSDVLFKIDPETLRVVDRYPIPAGGAGVRAGFGGVWVTMPVANELLHVDASSGEVVATIPVGDAPRFLAVGEGSVWVMNQIDGSVSRVDPRADMVTATIDTGPEIHGGDISVGGGSVWVRGGPEMLARIDPEQNLVTERYGPEVGSGSAAADGDAVWITAHDVSTIWRLPLD